MSAFAEVGGLTWEDITSTKLARTELVVLFVARSLFAVGLDL